MFEMFEREGWPRERRRTYILAHAAFLQRLSPADVATAAGRIMDDVNKMAPGGE